MTTDVTLAVNTEGYYDISFTPEGDIVTEQSFETGILMGLLEERRAAPEEVPESSRRRGWMGNESTPGFEMGSKVWLYYQSRVTFQLFNDLADVIREGEQWLIEGDFAVDVNATAQLLNGVVIGNLNIGRSSSEVDKKSFELWNNT